MAIFPKTWLGFWTNNGTPATGLAPTIQIRREDTGAIVQASAAMTEIGDGWYRFVQAAFDDSLQYVALLDGTSSVTPQERYQAAAAPADGEHRTTIADTVDVTLSAAHGASSWEGTSIVVKQSFGYDLFSDTLIGNVWVEINNLISPLAVAAAVDLYDVGGSKLFSFTVTGPDSRNVFKVSKTNPGLLKGQSYTAQASVTVAGVGTVTSAKGAFAFGA